MRLVFIGLFALLSCSYLPLASGLKPPGVEVQDFLDYIQVLPDSGTADSVGLLFWPGGLVDPHSYIAPMAEFSRRGYRVVIAKVPSNLAILSISKGLELSQRLGGRWVAAGHSLGGVAAAWTVADNPEAFEGLVMMASFPAEDKSLRQANLPVLSLYAEKDGLATPEEILANSGLLPSSTVYFEIPGGNHAGFGAYGDQDGDKPASISPATQHSLMADQMEIFWGSL
jgi:dienelactone hydrolase